jgi:prolipoprotein diacylglyceryltransferase
MIPVDSFISSSVEVLGITLQIWGGFFILAVMYMWYNVQKTALYKKKINPDVTLNVIIFSVIGGVFLGRLIYVLERPGLGLDGLRMWADIAMGRMNLFAGMAGAALLSYGYLKFFKVPKRHEFRTLDLTDVIVLYLPFALIIGRIGSLITHNIFGKITDSNLPFMFDYGEGVIRHPVVLYLIGGNLLVALVIRIVERKFPDISKHTGALTATFLIAYSFMRIGVDFFRETSGLIGEPTYGILTSSQIGYTITLIITLGLILRIRTRAQKDFTTQLNRSKPVKFS